MKSGILALDHHGELLIVLLLAVRGRILVCLLRLGESPAWSEKKLIDNYKQFKD